MKCSAIDLVIIQDFPAGMLWLSHSHSAPFARGFHEVKERPAEYRGFIC